MSVPPTHHQVLYWKLTENWRQLVVINLLALPLALVALGVFGGAAVTLGRWPDVYGAFVSWPMLVGLMVAIVLTLALHELAHGLAMMTFGAQPKYGIKWEAIALYATAPGYAFTRNQYLIVILAPLVSLSILAGAGMMVFAGTLAVPLLMMSAVANAMGACGDVYMAYRVTRYPAPAYVIDEADGMRVFMPI